MTDVDVDMESVINGGDFHDPDFIDQDEEDDIEDLENYTHHGRENK